MRHLQAGTKLSAVWMPGGTTGYSVDRSLGWCSAESITVVEVNGQGATVPWAYIKPTDYRGRATKPVYLNLALAETVVLLEDPDEAQV
jgi:hypothetical protein